MTAVGDADPTEVNSVPGVTTTRLPSGRHMLAAEMPAAEGGIAWAA